MQLGGQIRKYRNELNISQDELAEKVFVSRQSISNWENDKTYPDIKSLLLLSEVFSVSLDKLVKGDIEEMKKQIDAQELAEFQRDSNIFTILFLVFIIIPIPLVLWLGWLGMGIFLAVWMILMYYARRIEKYKKEYDIQTFKEIIAFTQGESLDELEKVAEVAKRPYQKPIIVAFVCLVTLIVSVLILAMAKLFSLI